MYLLRSPEVSTDQSSVTVAGVEVESVGLGEEDIAQESLSAFGKEGRGPDAKAGH